MAAREASGPGLSAVVLAGGRSSRFGSDKAAALLAGRPLLEWVVNAVASVCTPVLVVRARGQPMPPCPGGRRLRVLEDAYDDRGPLAGLVTAFAALEGGLCFAVSCDAPLLRPGVIRAIAAEAEGFDAVVPVVGGFPQPLVAAYRVEACLPVFRAAVDSGEGSIMTALAGLRVLTPPESVILAADPELLSFRNANTPELLADIARRDEAKP